MIGKTYRIKHETTIYNKRNPNGKNIIQTVKGKEVEQPKYLGGNMNGYIYIQTENNIIYLIETNRIVSQKEICV